jgi:S-ribosylhomocysteine lyase LuxS involved in autoinducer biosynthesis
MFSFATPFFMHRWPTPKFKESSISDKQVKEMVKEAMHETCGNYENLSLEKKQECEEFLDNVFPQVR